jgi:hypothetical protein
MTSHQTYSDHLKQLAEQLRAEAATANRKGFYGLADALYAAGNSARSWADGIHEEESRP